jgi:hypothetical protein
LSDNRTERTVRAFNYVAGTIKHHGSEPFCSDCKSFVAVVETVRESLEHFEGYGKVDEIPEKFKAVYEEAKNIIKGAILPSVPVKRRTAGDCVLPDKKCFMKNSRAFFRDCIKH